MSNSVPIRNNETEKNTRLFDIEKPDVGEPTAVFKIRGGYERMSLKGLKEAISLSEAKLKI